jgi:hypothetical protein
MRPLELDEALRIYRSRTGDTTSTDEEARSIVEQLGRDPLLIDLHDRENQDETPAEVVRSWITRELTAASQKTGTPAQRFRVALRKLAKNMLVRRLMAPSANDVEELYTGDPAQYDTLLAIIRETNVLRWDQSFQVESLAFRHDRIRDALLDDALNEIINTEPTNNVIADPHYSDYLGEVIVRR